MLNIPLESDNLDCFRVQAWIGSVNIDIDLPSAVGQINLTVEQAQMLVSALNQAINYVESGEEL